MGRVKKEQKKWKIGYVDVYKDPNNPLLVTTGEKIWSKKTNSSKTFIAKLLRNNESKMERSK